MIEALFFVPVGPNDARRALWTVQSIRAHCSDHRIHLLLDGPDPRTLPSQLSGPDICIHCKTLPTRGNWGRIWLMQCLAMSETLKDPNVSPRAVFVKMDSDAVVLRSGLIERAQAIFAT